MKLSPMIKLASLIFCSSVIFSSSDSFAGTSCPQTIQSRAEQIFTHSPEARVSYRNGRCVGEACQWGINTLRKVYKTNAEGDVFGYFSHTKSESSENLNRTRQEIYFLNVNRNNPERSTCKSVSSREFERSLQCHQLDGAMNLIATAQRLNPKAVAAVLSSHFYLDDIKQLTEISVLIEKYGFSAVSVAIYETYQKNKKEIQRWLGGKVWSQLGVSSRDVSMSTIEERLSLIANLESSVETVLMRANAKAATLTENKMPEILQTVFSAASSQLTCQMIGMHQPVDPCKNLSGVQLKACRFLTNNFLTPLNKATSCVAGVGYSRYGVLDCVSSDDNLYLDNPNLQREDILFISQNFSDVQCYYGLISSEKYLQSNQFRKFELLKNVCNLSYAKMYSNVFSFSFKLSQQAGDAVRDSDLTKKSKTNSFKLTRLIEKELEK